MPTPEIPSHSVFSKILSSFKQALRLRRQPRSSPPIWHESNRLWSAGATAIGIVLVVVAEMKKDLRFLLIFAWPFSIIALWAFTSIFRYKIARMFLTVIGAAVIGFGLYRLNTWLEPAHEIASPAPPALPPPTSGQAPAEPMAKNPNAATPASAAAIADEVAKKLKQSGQIPAVKTKPGFSVMPEALIINAGGYGACTGFWMGYLSQDGCSLSPSEMIMFIGITNIGPDPMMVTAYNFTIGKVRGKKGISKSNPELKRFDTMGGQFYFLQPKEKSRIGVTEGKLHIPEGLYMVNFSTSDIDAAHAVRIDKNDILDNELRETYLEPNKPVRGWVFFKSEGDFSRLVVNITDQLGRTFSYPMPLVKSNPAGDIMPRTFSMLGPFNLSQCSIIQGGP